MRGLSALVILFFGLSLNAAGEVTLGRLIKRFAEHSPELKAAKAAYDSQKFAVREAAGGFLPEVEVQVTAADQQSVFDIGQGPLTIHQKNYLAEVVVNQPIFKGGSKANAFRLSRKERDIAGVNLLLSRNAAIGGFVQAYAEYLHAKETLDVLKESAATSKNFFEITQRRRRSGAALAYELDQARADLLSYESRVRSAEARLENASRNLRALLQVDPEFPLDVEWPQFVAAPKFSKQAPLPELTKARFELEKAGIQKQLSVANDLPSLNIQATYGYQGDTWDEIGEDNTDVHSVGVVLKVPVFSGLSGIHRWRAAEKRREGAERHLRAVERDSRVQVSNAAARWAAAFENLKSSQNAAVSAKRAVRSGLENFRVGRINLFQIVQLQAAHEQAEVARIEAFREALLAEMNWASIHGEDLENYYVKNR